MNVTVKTKSGEASIVSDVLLHAASSGKDFLDLEPETTATKLGINLPAANYTETPTSYLVEVAAPGLQQNDFNVEVKEQALVVSVDKPLLEPRLGEFTTHEFSFHSFCRTFTLDKNSQPNHIQARYKQGILTITIPKKKPSGRKPARRVMVKGS